MKIKLEQRALIAEMGPYRLRSGIVVDRDGCEPGPRGGDRWKAALVAALNEIAAGAAPSEQGSGGWDDPAFLEAHVAEDTRQWKAHADAAYARGLASGERALAEERKKSSELRAAVEVCVERMPRDAPALARAVLARYPETKP
jgi:hypothetical protein